MIPKEEIVKIYPEAFCEVKQDKFRIRSEPFGKFLNKRWCLTEEKAWKAALQTFANRINRRDHW